MPNEVSNFPFLSVHHLPAGADVAFGAGSAHDAIMACSEPPPGVLWDLFRSSYGAMHASAKETADQLIATKVRAQRSADLLESMGVSEEQVGVASQCPRLSTAMEFTHEQVCRSPVDFLFSLTS